MKKPAEADDPRPAPPQGPALERARRLRHAPVRSAAARLPRRCRRLAQLQSSLQGQRELTFANPSKSELEPPHLNLLLRLLQHHRLPGRLLLWCARVAGDPDLDVGLARQEAGVGVEVVDDDLVLTVHGLL